MGYEGVDCIFHTHPFASAPPPLSRLRGQPEYNLFLLLSVISTERKGEQARFETSRGTMRDP